MDGDGDDDNDYDDENINFDDDDDNDDFVSDEHREEEEARKRREQRKRRLQALLSAPSSSSTDDAHAPTASESTKSTTTITPAGAAEMGPTDAPGTNCRHVQAQTHTLTEVLDGKNDQDRNNQVEEDDDGNVDDDDEFDMFDTSASPIEKRKRTDQYPSKQSEQERRQNNNGNGSPSRRRTARGNHQNDFDDIEGYYKAAIGEVIDLDISGGGGGGGENGDEDDGGTTTTVPFRVLGIIGKGVFSTVLKCSTGRRSEIGTVEDGTDNGGGGGGGDDGVPRTIVVGNSNNDNDATTTTLPHQVALKCIRSNETMAKAAQNEIKFLLRLRSSPGIVPLLLPKSGDANGGIEFRGHTILVFPYEPYNLRDVLVKFGKGVGLSLTAVRSYFGQLLAAATHLKQHRIIHADIKPDNILVNADFGKVLICDFGSAVDATEQAENGQSMITPYLVSRFYRAPEIILGLPSVTYAIDLWSLAVTAAELFLGRVLLQGSNNNDMLFVMMQHMGPFSSRMIRSHLLQTKKHPLPAHFSHVVASNYVFRQEAVDPVLGQAVHKEVSLVNNSIFQPSLQSKLLKARSPKDTRSQVLKFSDLLGKCLVLDPSKRITVKAALQHDFFKE